MTHELICAIQSLVLNARRVLERETDEQLQAIYGWLPDGRFENGWQSAFSPSGETRRLLERYAAGQVDAGNPAASARALLQREVAYTWLIRAVACRLMEARGLQENPFAGPGTTGGPLVPSLSRPLTPAPGKLADDRSHVDHDAGEAPLDAAFREFLLCRCGELAGEVSGLFDPSTLASRLCPRSPVLKELAASLAAAGLSAAWAPGNEETIGWVHEAFIEDEITAVFAKFSHGTKVLAEDIGAATQRFTPRWMVRFLVANSLGRIWVEMHPDSHLATRPGYLVPPASCVPRPLKLAREITFLDPCCGSMHWGLHAFDVFTEMYREEREHAGQPGWPSIPSAASDAEIPGLILACNLHGIDIDPRALQIAAFALFLKARTANPAAVVTDANLACANVVPITGGALDARIAATTFSHPVDERILLQLAARLKDSDHLGSLLRIEGELARIIAAERAASSQSLAAPGRRHPERFSSMEALEAFYTGVTGRIRGHLDRWVCVSREDGLDSAGLAGGGAKEFRLLRLVGNRYDVVATNPPYLSRRNMSDVMAKYLAEEYQSSKGDLYAACILRCVELAAPLGRVAMVTQQSFMFLSSYADLRVELGQTTAMETMAHLGPRAFPNITGEKVNTTAFVLRREPDAGRREQQAGTYFRLVGEPTADAKRKGLEAALQASPGGASHPSRFIARQRDFDSIPGLPYVYWVPESIRVLFQLPCFQLLATTDGHKTANNHRFVRFHWEIPLAMRGGRWRQSARCASQRSFVRNFTELVDLGAAAQCEYQSNSSSSRINPELMEWSAVSWSRIVSKRLTARRTGAGEIPDVSTPAVYLHTPRDADVLLAVLNSSLGRYLLALLNPTINFAVGDIRKLPAPPGGADLSALRRLVADCERQLDEQWNHAETSRNFHRPWLSRAECTRQRRATACVEAELDAEVSRLYGLNESDRAVTEREWNRPAGNGDAESDGEAGDDSGTAGWARSWLSYALGAVLGRFRVGQPGAPGCGDFAAATVIAIRALRSADGLLACDPGQPLDLAARAFACLELMLGAAPARQIVHTATGNSGEPVPAVRGWLTRFTGTPATSFWKYHCQLHRKCPVYWPFQSPGKTITWWVFHEALDSNILAALKRHVSEQLSRLEHDSATAGGPGARREMADDLREFATRIQHHIDAGYQPCFDDGVLLNAAPLRDLLPAWPQLTSAWHDLAAGKCDWARQALRHWPARVTAACRGNRSFAIAHGMDPAIQG